MATIRVKHGKAGTKYHVQIRLRGYPKQTATFDKKTAAKRWAQDTESAIRNGRYFRVFEARRHTLAELIDKYLLEVLGSREGGDREKRAAQLHWWRDQLGAYTLADVTPSRIADWTCPVLVDS